MTSIREALRIPLVLIGGALVVIAVPSGCASRSDENLGFENGGQPRFGIDAGADACGEGGCVDPDVVRPLCKSTACPVPYGTCSTDAFRCETNFDGDPDNCGACGVVCPHGQEIRDFYGAEWRCQSGQCQMACTFGFGDCNGQAADGCETNTYCDPNNCGGCGIKCADGIPCSKGVCAGCLPGYADCYGFCGAPCTNLDTDDSNCGACGTSCPIPEPPLPPHLHTKIGCVDAECGHLKCEDDYRDCNKDIETDGCEVNIQLDAANCGFCGRKCAPGQQCYYGQCECAPTETMCNILGGGKACVDLDTDPMHCGVCGHQCPEPFDKSARSACQFGRCALECPSGYADCDNRADNGCETMVSADPRNCGACGVQCDLAFGQPCVDGKCLVAPCGPGGAQ